MVLYVRTQNPAVKSVSSNLGEGVGYGRAHREVRQWGSKPKQKQDGRRGLITPLRSAGGHRRYSRYQLRIAARARELVDQGTPIEAACRIVILEDQLEEAQRINAEYREGVRPSSAADA